MALVKTIQEAKKYIRISNFNEDSTLPDMDAAAVEHLIPFCGAEVYDRIQAAYDNAALTPDEEVLLAKMQLPLVAWGYGDDLAFINATITDRGVTYTQTAEMPPVSRWAYNQLKSALLDKALAGVERMLEYLETNADKFPEWEGSQARSAYKKLLIRSGYEFAELYPLFQPLRTFISMKSIMSMVEEMYLEAAVGKEFLQSLKSNENADYKEKTVLGYLKKTVAYRTIWHAIQELPVRISENGFTVLEGRNPHGIEPGRAADNSSLLGMKLKAAEREGDHYLVRAKEYLDLHANADVFTEYFNSPYYTDPSEKGPGYDSGNDRRHLFRL